MRSIAIPAEIILSPSQVRLGSQPMDVTLQPGSPLEFEGQLYLVLERRHRYQFRAGRYQLHQIALYVQQMSGCEDKIMHNGQWVIGDVTCVYNAHSAMLRCTVNPLGSCDRCSHYKPIADGGKHPRFYP